MLETLRSNLLRYRNDNVELHKNNSLITSIDQMYSIHFQCYSY